MNPQRIAEKTGFALLLLIFLVPPLIPIHDFPNGSFWNEWSAGFLILLAFALVWLVPSKKITLPSALFPWLLWGASLFISALHAKYHLMTPIYMYGFFWCLGAFLIVAVGEVKAKFGFSHVFLSIAVVLLFSSLAQSLIGFFRFYGLMAWVSRDLAYMHSDRMLGILNYPTISGFSIWLGVYSLIYLFCKRLVGFFGLIVAGIPMLAAIVATGDRASALYGACFLFVFLVFFLRARVTRQYGELDLYRYLKGFLTILLLMVICFSGFNKFNRSFGQYVESLGYIHNGDFNRHPFKRGKEGVLGIRGTEFRKALHLAHSHFWLGIGPGNYPYQSFRLNSVIKDPVREGTINTHTHNIFSMILAEEGVIGVVVLCIGLFLLSMWWWRLGICEEAVFSGLVLGAFFVFSNLEFPLWYLNFLAIFLIFSTLISPIRSHDIDHGWVKSSASLLTLLVGGAVAINVAMGFHEISSIALDKELSAKDRNVLSGWGLDGALEKTALIKIERYVLPSPNNIGSQLNMLNKLIYSLPLSKALLDKAILLEFEGNNNAACILATKTASSYPGVVSQYESEMKEFQKLGDTLPHDPSRLQVCFQLGKSEWRSQ